MSTGIILLLAGASFTAPTLQDIDDHLQIILLISVGIIGIYCIAKILLTILLWQAGKEVNMKYVQFKNLFIKIVHFFSETIQKHWFG